MLQNISWLWGGTQPSNEKQKHSSFTVNRNVTWLQTQNGFQEQNGVMLALHLEDLNSSSSPFSRAGVSTLLHTAAEHSICIASSSYKSNSLQDWDRCCHTSSIKRLKRFPGLERRFRWWIAGHTSMSSWVWLPGAHVKSWVQGTCHPGKWPQMGLCSLLASPSDWISDPRFRKTLFPKGRWTMIEGNTWCWPLAFTCLYAPAHMCANKHYMYECMCVCIYMYMCIVNKAFSYLSLLSSAI